MAKLPFIAPLIGLMLSTPAIPQDRAVLSQPALAPPLATDAISGSRDATARTALVIERSFDGLFYVEARVNEALVRFVVDSGSSVVVLSAADARRASIGGREGVAVDTAAGSASMRRASIARVALAGRTLSDVDAAIVDRDLKVSLLGQSALSQLGSVIFRGDRLELGL